MLFFEAVDDQCVAFLLMRLNLLLLRDVSYSEVTGGGRIVFFILNWWDFVADDSLRVARRVA